MIKNIIYKLLILLLILAGIKGLFVLYLHAQGTTQDKNLDMITSAQSPYNCVIVGSSRTHNAVDPQIMDSVCAEFDLVSFNLGRPYRSAPETYTTMHYLLDHATTIKYMLVELEALATSRNSSADIFAPQIQGFVMNYAWDRMQNIHPAPVYQNLKAFATFSFKLKSALVVRPFDVPNKIEEYAGYHTLHTGTVGEGKIKKRERMLLDPPDVDDYKRVFVETMSGNMPDADVEYANALIQLAELAEERGVQVYYYLPYAIGTREIFKCIPVLEQIPSKYKVSAYQDPEWAELFQLDYHWDRGHLNRSGSSFYTQLLSSHLKLQLRGAQRQ